MSGSRNLCAGPVEAVFFDGELRHVRAGGAEIVERVYAAVRDHNWRTVPGRLENVSIEAPSDTFRIAFDSVHKDGSVDFRWRGTIAGTASGRISFAMDGRAYAAFLRNRIGLCVHHPLKECAGKPCVVEAPSGACDSTCFPEFVSPHQPFRNVRAISHEIAPGLRAEVRFSGDVFETEDHRNWTDANFKTYGTPLSLPFPVALGAGAEVRQEIVISLSGNAAPVAPPRERVVRMRAGGPSTLRLPRIGLGLGRALSDGEARALRRLRLSHLRCDAVDGRAAAAAQAIGARLEMVVTLPCDTAPLPAVAPLVDRWLVYSRERKAAGNVEARALRAALGSGASIVPGTNAYFAELNRNRPDGEGWDAACFSVNPQVHAFDDESVMANAAAQYDAVRSARRFLGRPVVVSPVTLRPRFNPDTTSSEAAPAPDPRQRTPFCAAWTVASLKALAEAGASSVTYYETSGPGGVLDGDEIYPVFRVFEAIGAFAGAGIVACASSDPARIVGLALESGGVRRMLVANLAPGRADVAVEGAAKELVLDPYAVETITWT